jgi:Zn-dependent protease
MVNMDNQDLSIPALPSVPPVTRSAPTLPALPPVAEERPDEAFGAPPRAPAGGIRRKLGSIAAAITAAVAKFFAAIKGLILLLPKAKLLTTAGTAMVSVAAYALFWGWTFAAGFVVLLFIHEMGHVVQLRREGIKASAPMFIPFLGAMISARSLGENALAEARVGLAGPVLGTLGAAVCLAIGEATNSDLLRALAYVGFFLNLFNLLPVVPLDGGRAMAAMAPWMWFLGFGVLVAMVILVPNPILLIIVVFGGLETYRRWKLRGTRSLEQAAYYRVQPRHRLIVASVYVGLVVLLALGMHEAHILSTGSHSFSSI